MAGRFSAPLCARYRPRTRHARLENPQDALPDASCGRLSDRLDGATKEGRPFEALHLLCHGTVAGSTFGLALEDDEAPGRVVAVDAGRLR